MNRIVGRTIYTPTSSEVFNTGIDEEKVVAAVEEYITENSELLKGDAGAAGEDGLTPYINVNGTWQIGDTDTGVKATGADGKSGVYLGSGDMPEDCNVQIDPNGTPFNIDTTVENKINKIVPDWARQPEKPKYTAEELGITLPSSVDMYAVPTYWEDAVLEAEQKVSALQDSGGIDVAQFVWATDTHIRLNHPASGKTGTPNNIGKLANRLMNDLNIPYFAITGDLLNEMGGQEDQALPNRSLIANFYDKLVNPVGKERCLLTLGNHDGVSIIPRLDENGNKVVNSNGNYVYDYPQLTREERFNWYFKPFCNDVTKVWGGPEYYYVDNSQSKMRYIILCAYNSGIFDVDENHLPVNNQAKVFRNHKYDAQQLKWLANNALQAPEDYSIVILSHSKNEWLENESSEGESNKEALDSILTAFVDKSTITDLELLTTSLDSNLEKVKTVEYIDVDFSKNKNEICGWFVGHSHGDAEYNSGWFFPIISLNAAGAASDQNFKNKSNKETSFDVVTVDKKDKKIYMTRLGAGVDRVVEYSTSRDGYVFILPINGSGGGWVDRLSTTQVKANTAPEGKKFGYWVSQDNTIVSYDKVYLVTPVRDETLSAIFVDESEVIEHQPIMWLTANPDIDGENIRYGIHWNLKDIGTVSNAGLILVDKSDYNVETFYHSTTDTNIFDKAVSPEAIKDSYTVRINKGSSFYGHTYIVRMWLIYSDKGGVEHTIYSDLLEVTKSKGD